MRSRGHILLISHQRSHSTLLAHILGSHPEIDGYSELHQHYLSPVDLRSMTQGAGSFESRFDHHQDLVGRLADQIVAERKTHLGRAGQAA